MRLSLIILFTLLTTISYSQEDIYKAEYGVAIKRADSTVSLFSQRVPGTFPIEDYGLTGIVDGAGGQYSIRVFNSLGEVYILGNNTSWTKVGNDNLGNPTVDCWAIACMFEQDFYIRGTDSSIWTRGEDHLLQNGGVTQTAPKKLVMPAGKKFMKITAGSNTGFNTATTRLFGLASDRTLWEWKRTSTTATQIASGVYDMAIVGPTGDLYTTHGGDSIWARIYETFYDGRLLGYNTQSLGTSYTNITAQYLSAGAKLPLRQILAQYTGLKVIDSSRSIFSCGSNLFGEVGDYSQYQFWKTKATPYKGDPAAVDSVRTLYKIKGSFDKLFGTNNICPSTIVRLYNDSSYWSWGRNKALEPLSDTSLQPYYGYASTTSGNYDSLANYRDIAGPRKIYPFTQSSIKIDLNANANNVRRPEVFAGVDRWITTDTITLDGGATQQQTTNVYTVGVANVWVQISGPNVATLNSNYIMKPYVSNLISGTYVFRNSVTNANGYGESYVSINVSGIARSNQIILWNYKFSN